ncbi:MAG TPA: peptidylprolyl isomerase [Campylobacterales bacterium]|nr:peptidylprolyl isomerase [Campylobacterales bacterium]
MITWMQHHKKYLVVTIWVATIAFIGAGFVGWGAYDFNSDRASSVAKVGDRKITVQEYQLAYANFYNFYNNTLGGQLTQEKADKMGLEKMVMQNIINETLLLNYADEIGLRVEPEEVKQTLINDDAFKLNGVFDKETYYRVIKQAKLSAKDYENGLKKQLLLAKIQNVLKLKPTKKEEELFVASMFMEDKLSVDLLYLDQGEAKVTEDEIKKYWEEHKTDYLTEKSYDLSTIEIKTSNTIIDADKLKSFYEEKRHNYKNSEGKILSFEDAKADVEKDFRLKAAKREALETYLLFKKSQMNATGTKNVKVGDTSFPVEKLKTADVGDVLKPIEYGDGYIVVKVKSINNPQPKAYVDAKAQILAQLQINKKEETLKKKAEARLGLFRGQNVGYVSRDMQTAIAGLTKEETLEFVNYVFDNNNNRGFKIIGDKAVLYQIMEQKLLSKDKLTKYAQLVNQNISQMKQAEVSQNLLKELRDRYDIEQYYKGN